MENWYKGDLASVLDLLRLADRMGVDSVSLGEHIVMGSEELDRYPYASPEQRPQLFDERTPFYESMVYLGAIAAVTKRMRLSTGVMLSPLRPATLLAKQLVTLDHLSNGRVEIGVGVGWQKLEYDAGGVPWDGRFGRMVEIAKACRVLWTRTPASFHGEHVNFEGVYCLPFPIQRDGVPQWFGIAPSDRNIGRMAEVADGWAAYGQSLETISRSVPKIKQRMTELGRDPSKFNVRYISTRSSGTDGPISMRFLPRPRGYLMRVQPMSRCSSYCFALSPMTMSCSLTSALRRGTAIGDTPSHLTIGDSQWGVAAHP
jgi:probable F420-dependent oxidoreductase